MPTTPITTRKASRAHIQAFGGRSGVSWATKCTYVTPGTACEHATWVPHFVGLRSSYTPKRSQAPLNACTCALEASQVFIGVVGTLVWCETDQKRPQTTLQHCHQTASKGLKGSHRRIVCSHFLSVLHQTKVTTTPINTQKASKAFVRALGGA